MEAKLKSNQIIVLPLMLIVQANGESYCIAKISHLRAVGTLFSVGVSVVLLISFFFCSIFSVEK